MQEAECCEDDSSMSGHNGNSGIIHQPDGLVPTLHVTTWHSERIFFCPSTKKFEYRLLRIIVYDLVTARLGFVI